MKQRTFSFEGKDHVATAGPTGAGLTWGVVIKEVASGASVYVCDMDLITRLSARKSPHASYFEDDTFLDSMIEDLRCSAPT